MSKAEKFAGAWWECRHVCGDGAYGYPILRVSERGGLVVSDAMEKTEIAIDAKSVPALIAWLQDTFLDKESQ